MYKMGPNADNLIVDARNWRKAVVEHFPRRFYSIVSTRLVRLTLVVVVVVVVVVVELSISADSVRRSGPYLIGVVLLVLIPRTVHAV